MVEDFGTSHLPEDVPRPPGAAARLRVGLGFKGLKVSGLGDVGS